MNPSESVRGMVLEIGDDDEGVPRMVICCSREDLARLASNLLYHEVVVMSAPSEPASRDAVPNKTGD